VTSLTIRVWAATAAVIIGLASSACSGHKSSSSPTHRPQITTSEWTPRPATTTPAATSEADAVRIWYASAGTHIRALSVATQQINNASQTPSDPAQLTTACQHLQDAVNGLQNTMPTPNAELTTEIQGAITDFGNAARGCLAAVPNHDQGAMDQAAQSMTSGGKHIDVATVILGRIVNGG
jgi:hypothetical protein